MPTAFVSDTGALDDPLVEYSFGSPLVQNIPTVCTQDGKSHENGYLRLPPIETTLALLQVFFEDFNCVFPLFDRTSFMALVNQKYTRDRGDDPVWWGALSVVLSLSLQLHAMSTFNRDTTTVDDQKAWNYLNNALSVVPDLTARDADLLGVQTLLGMAIILQGTHNPHPASVLIAAAVKLSHSLGLHRKTANAKLEDVSSEQRNRIFWIVYILDKDYSLQLDQPPMLRDDDMDIEVPSENPEDGLGFISDANEDLRINFFRLRVHLAIIEDKIYSRLYSVRALKQSEQSRRHVVQDLNRVLDRWKEGVPHPFRPGNMIASLPKGSISHIVILHLRFYDCLTMVHGVAFQNEDWMITAMQPENEEKQASLSCPSQGICIKSTRESLKLVRLLPQGDYACIWCAYNLPAI